MVYKQISCKAVIAKVLTDYSTSLENIRVTDMVSWVGEAINKIDAYSYYDIKITGKDDLPLLVVEDYQVQLPNDLKEIIAVKFSKTQNGVFYPLRYGTSSFGTGGGESTTATADTAPNTLLITTVMNLYDYTYEQALNAINTDSILREKINALLAVVTPSSVVQNIDDNFTLDYVYYILGNYMKLNVATGYIKIAYKAKPVDEEGYPLVPDDEAFMEALYWYIVMKLMYPEWAAGRIRDEVYYDSRRSWNYHCKQAYGKAAMPSGDKLEAMKNLWLTLYPEINTWDTTFSNLGNKQVIYNR